MAMNRKFTLRGWRGLLCGLAALALSACVKEELPDMGTTLKDGEISLQWVAANMGRVVTKGTDNKNTDEQKINNVHIFLFDADGKYLNSGNNRFQGYRYLEDGWMNWILETSLFTEQDKAKNATVYVLANMPEDLFTDLTDGYPENVPDMTALESLTVKLPEGGFTTEIPETGLPMVLKKTGVDLSNGAATKVVTLPLRSMMARIDLNFNMEPLIPDGNLPSLQFTEVAVGNFPKGGIIKSQLTDMEDGTTLMGAVKTDETSYGLIEEQEKIENAPLLDRVLRTGNELSMTLYMFEHAREAEDIEYPEGIDMEKEAQRYKNRRAAEDAAYVEFSGMYTTQNGLKYHVTYRLYVGANPNDDFTIKPNCQYKNNITITGVTVNNRDPQHEALLDTRVDVDNDPVFIEMLRERMFDAHFNVTPMDVYIWDFDAAQSVTVTILNEEGEPAGEREMTWIRMEPYYHAPAEKCDYKEATYAAARAGDGKRRYFTTNLLTEMNEEYNRSYMVTQKEERIYFYMDENVPTEQQYDDREDVPEREATIKITYTAKDGSTTDRYATFTQAGMKIVRFNKFGTPAGDGGMWGGGGDDDAYYFYLEHFEEYLSHYDGKNEYTATYDGMEWGLEGVETGLGVPEGENWDIYMKWGWYNTAQIMKQFRHESSWRGHEMTLNELPSGAAEYCYNKNKRSENNNYEAAYVEWFLPTISEIEYAMDRYYTEYDEFRNNYYWSSNPGAIGHEGTGAESGIMVGNEGENPDYARATKTSYRNGVFSHTPSAVNEEYPTYYNYNDRVRQEGGHAKRTEKFRVRAVYVPRWIQEDLNVH